MRKAFYFFDIDGVLLKPLGYRKATEQAVKFFLKEWGVTTQLVKEDELSMFESFGITSEWDMVPLYLIAYLESAYEKLTPVQALRDHEEIRQFFNKHSDSGDLKLISYIAKFKRLQLDGMPPSNAVLNASNNGSAKQIFPFLFRVSPWVFDELLRDTRDVERSKTTRLFQNLILGSQLFKQKTALEPKIKTESYLLLYDQNMLRSDLRERMTTATRMRGDAFACMTARPSLSPIPNRIEKNFFPEAELAQKLVGFEQFPVIGFGFMQQTALSYGGEADLYLKPSPFHAMAALLSMCKLPAEEVAATAFGFFFGNTEQQQSAREAVKKILPNKIDFFVFEDSPIGIRSVTQSGLRLRAQGFDVQVRAHGITSNPNKKTAIIKEGAAVYPDINAALESCLLP